MATPIRVGLGPGHSLVDIDPDQLTPRARALAQVWASAPLGWRAHIMLESTRTLREMGATDADALWYGADALDRPHRIPWSSWARWPEKRLPDGEAHPADYTDTGHGVIRYREHADGTRIYLRATVVEYLETQAARLPVGYVPVGLGRDDRVPAADAPDVAAAADLITREQVLEVLRRHGRPISMATLDNYRRRPPTGWPQPVDYVGRTPRWSHPEVVAYARAAADTGGVAR